MTNKKPIIQVPSKEDQLIGIDGIVEYLTVLAEMRKKMNIPKGMMCPEALMLKYGCIYIATKNTFKGKRDALHKCYMNAAHIALNGPDATYVEGYVNIGGVPIAHAWTVNASGEILDTTLRPNRNLAYLGYFGIPFNTDFLKDALLTNRVYGLLDGFAAAKTFLPMLRGERKDFLAYGDKK